MSFFRRRFGGMDFILLGGVVVLAVMGLASLASFGREFFYRQLVWYGLFFLVVFLGSQLDWRWFMRQSWFRLGFYWLSVFLVTFAYLQPGEIRGSRGWIVLDNFQFEPVELVKVALILMLGGFFAKRRAGAWLGKNIVISFFYALVPAAVVFLHPDFGSALVVMSIWMGFLLMSGFHLRRVIAMGLVFCLAAAAAWFLLLRPYQKDRLISFLFPDRDPQGASYNVIQSKVAIGSAGFFGKGYGMGTQTHLDFLPEAETDFVFAGFVEEWGLVGGALLALTFFLIVFRITSIGLASMGSDAGFMALGTALVLMVHFFVNVGSNLGVMPATGIPLPFVSYGGSHLLTTALLVSIIQRIKIES